MRRRFRTQREIPFSFDSFLDLVANVVGIIIRLILVVWVGARSYSSVKEAALHPHRPSASGQIIGHDPMEDELERHRRELADAQAKLLKRMRELGDVRTRNRQAAQELAVVADRKRSLDEQRRELDHQTEKLHPAQDSALTLSELREREKRLIKEIDTLEKLPARRQVMRYQTPVSQPVEAEQFMFECRAGRVTFIDMTSLQAEIKRAMSDKADLLRTRWQVSAITPAVGPFRVRYTVQRVRGLADAVAPGSNPDSANSFSYGVSDWTVEPIAPERGETLAQALSSGSDFRRIADTLDPQQAVVTFWVYPDSFTLFRELRDYLYRRDLIVAGRPLPLDAPIAASRKGTVSRGQ